MNYFSRFPKTIHLAHMNKPLFFIAVVGVISLTACTGNTSNANADQAILQARIDSLQRRLDDAYKPGLGEFMSGIQVHHAKLWFAGTAANWQLANFEIGEIKETLGDIEKYCPDRPEITSLPMIRPAMDSVARSIADENPSAFRN